MASDSDPGPDPNIGRIVAERYRIDKVIAKGGMGAVYLGEHVHMRNRVAIKLLHADTEDLPVLVARFERESVVGAHARHPNVGVATDFGKDVDGSFYLVMEYVDGVTLRSVIDEGPLDALRAVDIALQIARGLEAIHDLEILHRDLNPRNVMLAKSPPGQVKLIDFGFARVPLENFSADYDEMKITSYGEVFGTIGFIPPEAAMGMIAVENTGDLYALGVIFYEMLTGQHPFDIKDQRRLFQAHAYRDVPPPSTRAPRIKIPSGLEAVIMRLLQKAPEDRYESATATIEAIEKAAEALDTTPQIEVKTVIEIQAAEPRKPPSAPPVIDMYRDDGGPDPRESTKAPQLVDTTSRRPSATSWLIPALIVLIVGGGLTLYLKKDWRERALSFIGRDNTPTTPASSVAPPSASTTTTAATSASAHPKTTAVAPSASVAPVEPERPSEVDGLDADAWQAKFESAVSARNVTGATQALFALAKIDPKRFDDPALRRIAATAAVMVARGRPDATKRLFTLLAQDLGSAGPDVLFRMVTHHGGSKGATEAARWLSDEVVRGRATAALRVAIDMRNTACGSRIDLFDRAVKEGDQRVLATMVAMDADNCMYTCCMRYNSYLDEAMRKLRERL